MPDNLTTVGGRTMFVANVNRGHPWHKLGQQMRRDMSIDEAIQLCGADDHVTLEPVYGVRNDPNTTPPSPRAFPEDRWVFVRSNKYGNMHVASPKFKITQRRRIVELAYEFVGLNPEDAHVDTMGNLGDHAQQFFAYIRCPELVIDPNGIADIIERGLFTATSFNGTLKNIIGYSLIRVVCSNTLQMAMQAGLQQAIEVTHIGDSEGRMFDAARAAGFLGAVERSVVAHAEQMLRVDGTKALDAILDGFWPLTGQLTDKAKSRRMGSRGMVRTLYNGEGNISASRAGENGWAAYQAFVEYLDHERGGIKNTGSDPGAAQKVRAETAVMPGVIANQKIKASELVLALGA